METPFTTIVFFELFLVFAIRSPRQNLWQVGFWTNKALIYAVFLSMTLQVMVIYVPFFQTAFHTEPLTPFDWVRTLLISLSAFLIVELFKVVRQLRTRAAGPTRVAPT